MDTQDATRILIVDDSKFFSRIVTKAIVERIGAEVVTAGTLAAAREILDSGQSFHLALVDIILPDSSEGEAAEYLMQKRIPCIVFTSFYSEDLRKMILDWNVMDYVIKDTPSSLSYLVDIVERVHRNRETKILVVDDSKTSRQHVRGLLTGYQCQVIEAGTAQEALDLLEASPDIRLVITDYFMPGMNGVELVQEIRKKFDREQLAIIGIASGVSRGLLSAQFIKLGANDFLKKPFLPEEFFCRISQNLRMLDLFSKLKDMGIRDTLTGIHNRRFFFEAGTNLFATANRDQIRLTAALIDLDYPRDVETKSGQKARDTVLKGVAELLRRQCRQTDIVARYGLDSFAILAVNLADESIVGFFERIRKLIEEHEFGEPGKPIRVTASFGVCHGTRATLEGMMKEADDLLNRAKKNGRNRVEISRAAENASGRAK
ncbi:MAG TPA: diguanylate cyclase [Patescibacteria group bacterium]|nr:diguanylate cyclase [Patescibacteria group bacterium]